MKKLMALLLVAMMLLSLAACGTWTTSTAATTETAAEQGTEATAEPAAEETAVPEETAAPEEATAPEETSVPEETVVRTNDYTFEPFTPADNSKYAITVEELIPDGDLGCTIKVLLANKSAKKTYEFGAGVYVNGVYLPVNFDSIVDPNTEINGEITLSDADLEEVGFASAADITDIEISFEVIIGYDPDSENIDDWAEGVFHVYPYGEENATKFVYTPQPTDQVIVDNENVTIIVVDSGKDSDGYYYVRTLFENNSDNAVYGFSMYNSVNGVGVVNGYLSLQPDTMRYYTLNFDKSMLEIINPEDVTDIEINFVAESYSNGKEVANEVFHFYPYGEENATQFVYTPQPTDQVIVDNDKVTVIVTGTGMDSSLGYTVYSINMFIQNKTDKDIMVGVDDVSINGIMVSSGWGREVKSGKCILWNLTTSQSSLEEKGITEIESIELTFNIFDTKKFKGIYSGTVTVNP